MTYNRNQITSIRLKRYIMENRMFAIGKRQILYLHRHIFFFYRGNIYFNMVQICRSYSYGSSFFFWNRAQFSRRPFFFYAPVFHIEKTVCKVSKIIKPVFSNNDCVAFRFKSTHQIFKRLNGIHIQIGRRFIKHINFRINSIDGGHRYFLFFPARHRINFFPSQHISVNTLDCT